MEKKHGYEYLIDFMHGENFRYSDEDDYFAFKVQGQNYIAFKNDSPYLQVVQMVSTTAERLSREQLLEVCNDMNMSKFITKCVLIDDSSAIWCNYEFEPNGYMTSDDWMQIFDVIDMNTDELLRKMNEKAEDGEAN